MTFFATAAYKFEAGAIEGKVLRREGKVMKMPGGVQIKAQSTQMSRGVNMHSIHIRQSWRSLRTPILA